MANIKVDRFTTGTAATWTKPTGCAYVRLILIGGGGGGGGGCDRASATGAGGGGGGGGSGVVDLIFGATELGTTETYTVGAGGTLGAAGVGTRATTRRSWRSKICTGCRCATTG